MFNGWINLLSWNILTNDLLAWKFPFLLGSLNIWFFFLKINSVYFSWSLSIDTNQSWNELSLIKQNCAECANSWRYLVSVLWPRLEWWSECVGDVVVVTVCINIMHINEKWKLGLFFVLQYHAYKNILYGTSLKTLG